jgi:hypothetical protein
MVAIVPLLGVFAFATLRLLPALQQIYHAVAGLQLAVPCLTTCILNTPLQWLKPLSIDRLLHPGLSCH